ncbi:MAG TPA: hypothetical protein VF666_19360 [Pyrinomonadaceae bacterium]|jgi:hypothetical protein
MLRFIFSVLADGMREPPRTKSDARPNEEASHPLLPDNETNP